MRVHSVAEVNGYIRGLVEGDGLLCDLWVSGEVSNLSESQAGHLYFTLKDGSSQLRCVFFRPRQPVAVESGMAVVVHGRISIYEVSGALQLYVDLVQPEGVGVLHLEFQRLKAALEEEGLFDEARKRPLPRLPRRIGLVTSPGGAVLHDIITIVGRRYPLVELVLAPTPVQGAGAVEGIVAALAALNERDDIDVIVVARGGGSLEELWAFNEEQVARAIYASRVPIVSAVGHETDFTIADFVADVRAPTPSAAAEVAVPHRLELEGHIRLAQRSLASALADDVARRRDGVERAANRLAALLPDIDRHRQRIDELAREVFIRVEGAVALCRERLRGRGLELGSLGPMATLGRGYALVQRTEDGEVVSAVRQVRRGDSIDVRVSDGELRGRVTATKEGLQPWMRDLPSKRH